MADTRESSANSAAKARWRSLSRSLIIMIKRIGPRTVPWGTPDSTGEGEDRAPLAETCWYRRERKVWSHAPILPPMRAFFILEQRMAWSTLSNALAKSR